MSKSTLYHMVRVSIDTFEYGFYIASLFLSATIYKKDK